MSQPTFIERTLTRFTICMVIFSIYSGTALAGANYGAIAFSPSTGGNGYAFGLSTRESAEQVAISECEKYSNSNDCQSVVTTEGGCAALAVGADSYGSAVGNSSNTAQRSALRNCRSAGSGIACQVIRWLCH